MVAKAEATESSRRRFTLREAWEVGCFQEALYYGREVSHVSDAETTSDTQPIKCVEEPGRESAKKVGVHQS